MLEITQQPQEYGESVQKLLLSYMITDPNAFSLCQNIIKPEYFNSKLRSTTRYILEYAAEFRTLPTTPQIEAHTSVTIPSFEAISPQHNAWFLKTVEGFCRYKALELVILEGPELLEKGAGAVVETRVREAMTISLMTDLGTDYFDDPKARLERLKDRSNYITTGWRSLDEKLYGGFTKGALNIFAGGSGSGKSLFLQNIALSWALMGMNVVYFSLELSEDLVSMRIDAMTSGFGTKEILKRINEVAIAVTNKTRQGAGDLRIKTLDAGSSANDIRAYLKEYEIQTGKKIDAIVVDYLDLMHPNDARINPGDLFVKDKYTSEEMRGIAREMDCLCVTASQLNRQSVEASEFDHSHIAGGISKINTADNVFGIFTTAQMRENGEYQIQFLKTRSSAAVGQKLKLKFRNDCLLIEDHEDFTSGAGSPVIKSKTATEIQAELKAKTNLGSQPSLPVMSPVQVEEGDSLRDRMMELMKKSRGMSGGAPPNA